MSSANDDWTTLNGRLHSKYGFGELNAPFVPTCPYEQLDLDDINIFLQRPDTAELALLVDIWRSRFLEAFPIVAPAVVSVAPKSFTQTLVKEMLQSILVYPTGPPTVAQMRTLAGTYKCNPAVVTKLKLFFAAKGPAFTTLLESLLKKSQVLHIEKPIKAYFSAHSRNDVEQVLNLQLKRAATEEAKQRKAQTALDDQALREEKAAAADLVASNEESTQTQIKAIHTYINSLEKPVGNSIPAPHTTDLEELGKKLFDDALKLFTEHSTALEDVVSAEIHLAHHTAIMSLTVILHFVRAVQIFQSPRGGSKLWGF